MTYGICRIKKLKASNLKASAQHTERRRFTPNADPDKPHICLIGDEKGNVELDSLVRERIGHQTIRKNGVLAVEFLLSASPEYFRPDDRSEAGYWEQSRLDDFQTTAVKWLRQSWGDRIVRAVLHLDEATPHIHAYLVPLDERGKLNCRGLFGTRAKLSQLQDSYAQAMSGLGLERGIKGSRATHTQVKKYYTAVTQAPNLTLDEAGIQHQLADRGRILKQNKELKLTAKALSQQLEAKERCNLELEVSLEAWQQQAQHWQQKYQNLTNTTERIHMQAVAYELGLSPREGTQDQWRNHENVFKITDSTFFDLQSSQSNQQLNSGNSGVDLVMQVNGCNFNQALSWLNDRFGEAAIHSMVEQHIKEVIKQEPVPKYTLPLANESHWLGVQNYLIEELKISSQLVDKLYREGLLCADGKHNLVSICRTLTNDTITGATISSTAASSNKFTSLATGSKREGWFYFEGGGDLNQPIERAVLVDSPLDALSMATLDCASQKTIYVSLFQTSQVPYDFLRSLPAKSVLIALNNNPESEKLAHQIRQQLPKQTVFKRPSVDWNTELTKAAHWQQQQGEYTQSRGIHR